MSRRRKFISAKAVRKSPVNTASACALAIALGVGGLSGTAAAQSSDPGLQVTSSGLRLGALGTDSLAVNSSGSTNAGTAFQRVAQADTGARLVRTEDLDGDPQVKQLWINSPSFGKVVRVGILLPKDRSQKRPTLQMLDGLQGWQASGDESLTGGSAWLYAGGARDFFRDKNLNVVLSVNGGPTYYRDWATKDPLYGTIAWDTFLAKEVPQVVDENFEGNGVWGISGISMGAHAAAMQLVRHPEVYSTFAGFSGCYDTSSAFGRAQIQGTLSPMKISPMQIFGPASDARWKENDPWLNLDAFKGKTVWMSAASGRAGVSDWESIIESPKTSVEGSLGGMADNIPGSTDFLSELPNLDPVLAGGPYEAIAMNCTRRLEKALAREGVSTDVFYDRMGVHDWALWKSHLPKAWPTIARGLGVSP